LNLMKPIFLIPDLGSGGAQRVLATLVNELCRKWQVKIIKLDCRSSHYTIDPRVEVVNLTDAKHEKKRLLKWATGMMRLRRELKKEQQMSSEVAVISFLPEFSMISMLFKPRGIPMIVCERSAHHLLGSAFWRILRKFFYPRADALTVQFPEDADYYRKWLPNVEILTNPCSFEASASASEKDDLVLVVSRPHPVKNISMFLRAVSMLDIDLRLSYRFCVLGEGELKQSLMKEAEELGIPVEFLGAVKNVEDFYKKAKIICLCSHVEGMPNVLIESLFFEVARISTKSSGGTLSLIEDGSDGFLVEKDDAQAMGEKMALLMRDEDLRTKIVQQANKKRELFDVKNVAKQWMGVIQTARKNR